MAWYPIYRIPDGNFRAAFLTFHSLGCLVHRSTSSNLADDITQIISPVVGMRSYNAKVCETKFRLFLLHSQAYVQIKPDTILLFPIYAR